MSLHLRKCFLLIPVPFGIKPAVTSHKSDTLTTLLPFVKKVYVYVISVICVCHVFQKFHLMEDHCLVSFSSTGRKPASLCHGPLPVVRPLTFSLKIFFSETTHPILMKFHRNILTMVLFRIS